MMPKYDWQDGKGKVHSRPKKNRGSQLEQASRKRARQQNRANDQLLNDPAYFTGPQSYASVGKAADTATDLRYGPAVAQNALQQRQVPAWFDQYRASLQTPAQVQAQYAPTIQAQQATAQQTAAPTAGIDPNSEAGKTDALAAKAREALAQLGTTVLQSQQQADTTYFAGRQGVANAAQIGAMGQLGSEAQSLAGERGAYRDSYVTDARERERAYGLASRHQTVEEAAYRTDLQKLQQDAADKGNEVNQYGVKNSTWARWSRTRRKNWIADFNADTATPSKPGEPKYGIDAKVWATMSPEQRKTAKDAWEKGGSKGSGDKDKFGNTKVQRRSARNAWDGGLSFLRANKSLIQSPNAITAVQAEANVPHDIAALVVAWSRNKGMLTPAQARKLRRLGVKVSPGHIKSSKGSGNGPGTSSGGGGGPEGTGQTSRYGSG